MKTPLTVTSVHQPKAIENSVAVNSVNIIREVLSAAGYDDHWTITFTRQSTKRSEIKFQYSRKSTANSLLIRTKPGNNSTCWDALLTVPKKYGIDEVIGTLKRIHPRKLTLGPSPKLTHEAAQMPFDPLPPPSLETILGIHAVIPKPPRIKEHPTKEDVKSALDDVDQEVQKRLVEAERQAKLEAETKQTLTLPKESNWVQPTPEGTLSDIPLVHKDIGNEPVILDHALVAVASRMDANRRFVTIPDAVGTLISQLRLDFFVTQQDGYKSPTRTATVILMGLVNKGLLQKDGRYEFTALGLRRLQKLSEVNQEIFSRLNINWLMDLPMAPVTKMPILPPVQMPTPVPAPAVAMASVKENQTRLKPLSEEIDRLMSQISDYETIEADCISSLQTVDDALKGLGATVATLRAELEAQIARMNTYEQQKVNLALDLNEAQKIKASYAMQLEKIKAEIRTILGAA